MELNSKSLAALKRLAQEDVLTDEDFGQFVDWVLGSYSVDISSGSLAVEAEKIQVDKFWKKRSSLELKEIVAALYMFVTELARHNTDKLSAGQFYFYSVALTQLLISFVVWSIIFYILVLSCKYFTVNLNKHKLMI